ncbi:MAG: glutaredoxin [Oscillospiraceae bacterium]|nr:glutaredoxin [Oscillospiraceae bacterium]
MKQVELFHLTYCPYCVNARRAIEELREEDPAFGEIEVRWIEESEEKELADSRDYYYVPTVYYAGQKLYEARPTHSYSAIKKHIRKAFEQVLSA